MRLQHHETRERCQSTSDVRASILQHLMVCRKTAHSDATQHCTACQAPWGRRKRGEGEGTQQQDPGPPCNRCAIMKKATMAAGNPFMLPAHTPHHK